MLNISKYSIDKYIDKDKYSVFKMLEERSISKFLLRLLAVVFIVLFFSMFLPWTQNIRTQGFVTTLNPYERPQAIQSLIDGRIKEWKVVEGDLVSIGDTILLITESKEDYLDPQLLERTMGQIDAKKSSASAYQEKAGILSQQYDALLKNKAIELKQNDIKINQERIKIKTDSLDLAAALIKQANASNQMNRTNELYKKGIKSLTDLEIKTLSFREAQAKVNSIENKIENSLNELARMENNKSAIINDYDQKLAKISSERMSSLSLKYDATSDINKLESNYNKYEVRSNNYVITSPINGRITLALKQGIGEYIKAGEDLVTIVPSTFKKAVEIYIKPRDVPLLKVGQNIRIQFDGWPAIIFSGWPENSFGTFEGEIYAIDNDISDKKPGSYRVLAVEKNDREKWPNEVRVGGGANGIILLNEVSVYYELWRQLNGFPPDYYQDNNNEQIKVKAPIRKIK